MSHAGKIDAFANVGIANGNTKAFFDTVSL